MTTVFSPTNPPPLVGRAREQDTLRQRLDTALTGHGGLVLITGEAGIGKTALAEDLCRTAEGRGALALIGRCYDFTETPPYGPWIELFARYPSSDALPLPAAFARRGEVGAIARQDALFHQVHDFCAALSASRPLVILLDDLQWADPASIELVRFLARSASDMALLLVATYRADELAPHHALNRLVPAMVRESFTTRLALRRFNPDAVHALVTAWYRLPERDVPRLVMYLHGRSEGNPFFIVELLHALEDERAVRVTDEGWRLGGLVNARIPPLLEQVIETRLARLEERAQHLLTIAAVIGQEVVPTLWAAVAGETAETVLTVAEQAIKAHIIEETPDGMRLRFVHALLREALSIRLIAARRAIWHRRAAEALASADGSAADVVAYHFLHAGDARAGAWLVQAGERAMASCAFATAIARFEEALPLLQGEKDRTIRGEVLVRLARMLTLADTKRSIAYADEAVRIAEETGDRALAMAARYRRGSVHGYAGSYRQGLTDLEAASDLFETLSPDARARIARKGLALVDADELRGATANTLQIMGRYEAALRMLGYAPDQSDGPLLPLSFTGFVALSVIETAMGRPAEARAASAHVRHREQELRDYVGLAYATEYELSEIVLIYQADQRDERQRLVAEADEAARQALDRAKGFSPRTARVGLLMLEGEWTEARVLLLDAYHAGGLPGWRLAEPRFLGQLAYAQGETEQVWSLVREMLPDGPATEPGDVYFINGCAFQRLAIALALDANDPQTARSWLEAHDRWLAWSGAVLGRAERDLCWSGYYQAVGDPAAAFTEAVRAVTRASEPRQPLALLAAHRLLGELHTDAGQYREAMTHLDASLALADACAAPYERALTLLAMAATRIATGERDAARTLIEAARAIGEPLGARLALARADAVATGLGTAKIAPRAYPAGLTAREIDVLRLVATGLTDGQVAERLSLSPRTVGRHLTSIYTKLGVSTRTAAGRFAMEHHLA